MKNRTILFDANSLMGQPTGVGYYTAGLIAALAKANPKSQFVGYYYNFLGRKPAPASPVAANIHYKPILHFPGPLVNALRRLHVQVPIELLTLRRADFVLYPNFLSQPSLFGTPNAPVIHDLMFHDHPEYGSDKAVRDLQQFVPSTLRRARFILTVSEFTKSRVIDTYNQPAERIVSTFIPPVAITTVRETVAQSILKKHKLTKPYMLFVGTLEPRKNLINLLEAYCLLPEPLRQQYSLVLAGKMDWKYQETKQKLESLQAEGYDVHYLGYIDNDTRAALYQGARLTILAAHYEGFGMQILESLQYGVPCVVSDIPVLHEVGGERIDYFDQTDPLAMSQAIETALNKPRPDAQALQAYVAQKPSWRAIAHLVTEEIERQCATPKKGNT